MLFSITQRGVYYIKWLWKDRCIHTILVSAHHKRSIFSACVYHMYSYLVVMCETLRVKWSQFVALLRSQIILKESSADTVEEV